MYSQVPPLRPQLELVESGLNREQASFSRSIFIEEYILLQKQVVLIVRVILTSSGLYSGTLTSMYPFLYIVPYLHLQ